MRKLSQFCVRHRVIVVVTWLLVLIITTSVARAVGTDYNNNFSLPKTGSAEALHLLNSAHAQAGSSKQGDTEQVVFFTTNHTKVTSPANEKLISEDLKALSHAPHIATVAGVARIIAPVPGSGFAVNPAQVATNGEIAYANVSFDELGFKISTTESDKIINIATSKATSTLHIAVEGQIAEATSKPSLSGTGIGALFALLVLLFVFGSIFAALLPLISALVALGTATSILAMLTHAMNIAQFAPELVALIGLGVGVDYALFIVTRHRQGLMEGLGVEESIIQAVNTSGRAVLFAGIIVCIALLGMFALPVSFLYGLAIGASIGVALTMIAALTLLPAVLSYIGPRILSRKQRRQLAPDADPATSPTFWSRWASFVDRRPLIPAVIALVVIGFIAAPYFSLRLGASDAGSDPAGTTTRIAYDELARGFGPGFNGPLMVVADVRNDAQATAAKRVEAAIRRTAGVVTIESLPSIPTVHDGVTIGEIVVADVVPRHSPESAQTANLLTLLRNTVIPRAASSSGLHVYVGGVTATFADFSTVLASKLPLFIAIVVFMSFLLLMVVFRSIVIPLLSAAMNLISIGAAFGLLVAVFQWGWGMQLLGVTRAGPIESFLPVMMFAILFGLSMDYQVFLVTRVHEEWIKSGDNRTAIRLGLARTGKTITAAAAIMIVVFASFILGDMQVIKEFGLGLAGGVLVDAVIIRMAIVPALMHVFGRANWWFPRFLDRWLPRIGLEHE